MTQLSYARIDRRSAFNHSGVIMRELPSVSTVAQAPMTQADVAEARPAQGEADQIASIRPQTGDVGESAGDDASRPTAAVDPRMPAAVALLTGPVDPEARVRSAVRGTAAHVGRWFDHIRRATARGHGPLQRTPVATANCSEPQITGGSGGNRLPAVPGSARDRRESWLTRAEPDRRCSRTPGRYR